MKRARVLHVVEALGLGGLERVVALLARRASPRFAVEVLALARGGQVAAEMEADGTPVRRLDLHDYYPGSVLRVARALVTARPDVVHTHGHFAGAAGRLAARLVGLRVVVHHLHTADDTLRLRHRHLERLLAALTRRVICCSDAVAEHARRELGISWQRVVVVRNGIDPPPPIGRDAARLALGRPPEPVIGCVAALQPHKGHTHLLQAVAALPEALRAGSLVLAGAGPERARLEAQAAALGLGGMVRFLGERPDVRDLLPAFDLMVAPSIGREGLGVAVLEAMDAGIPVVASRVGGLSEVVLDRTTGTLVPEGDVDALAGAMRSLLTDPVRARAFGDAGRRRVEDLFRAAGMVRR
ncbi:MAG TPA: glycosyltransferase, partial [Dongiaceae bacterium]|nr:glycosyltransferase [Dongiaceae bacterium]